MDQKVQLFLIIFLNPLLALLVFYPKMKYHYIHILVYYKQMF